MPCPHKFIENLNLENLDFTPTTLMVGTFNPAWPANNQAQWFYGRTPNNYFWDVLPALYQQAGLRNINAGDRPVIWKQFCNQYQIGITDLVSWINDADQNNPQHQEWLNGYADAAIAQHFNDFTLTNIVGLLQEHVAIQNVYLTTRAQIPLFNQIWNEVETYCLAHEIHCKRLLTPSGSARYQITDGYNPQFPVFPGVLGNFILENWQQEWHVNNY
ncbi:MAG TPA: hypothetical protein VGD22_07070 [Sphingobacteriaceae bacterium]